jgi:hypothetical protein
MGPIIILDKSAFQSMSHREHVFLHIHFEQNLTPILVMEILGDLSKQPRGSRTAEQVVEDLAGKFGGSGPVVNLDYLTLCYNSMLGVTVPMDRRIIPSSQGWATDSDGEAGMIIEPGPLNAAILKWSYGAFDDLDRQMSQYWRETTKSLSFESLERRLRKQHVLLPRIHSETDLTPVIGRLLETPDLQRLWLGWLFDQISLPEEYRSLIENRWRSLARPVLRRFAPYAYYCLRVLLLALLATRHALLKWQPSNLLDLQYHYYVPFCKVFASDDGLHRLLAPLLMDCDQTFVVGSDLKLDLFRLAEEWRSFTDQQKTMLRHALCSYPPPARGSIVYDLWKRYALPWRPESRNFASHLSEGEMQDALEWVKRMFIEVEGEAYFQTEG